MICLVSFVPEDHYEEPLTTEVALSESYDEVVQAACDMWRHHMPPESQIASRTLARQIQRTNGPRWVTLQPQRFTDLVRRGGFEEFELRLQIEREPLVSSPVDSFKYDVTLDVDCASPDSLPGYGSSCGPYGSPIELASLFVESVQMLTAQLTPQSPFELFEGGQHCVSPADQLALPPYSNLVATPATFDNGVSAFLAGRHAESRTQLQQAASAFHESGDVRGEADCLLYLGMSFRHSRDFVTARSSLLAAQAMYTSLGPGYRSEQLQCSRHLARVEEDRGNLQQALIVYQELLRTTEQEGLVTQHSWCSYYIGHLYNRMQMHKEALDTLKDVVNMSREICDGEMEGFATEEIGYTAELQGRLQLAMSCYEKALGVFKINGEGRWTESEKRVKKRIDRLRHGYPELRRTSVSGGWSFGARI